MTHIRITIDELVLNGASDLDQTQLIHALQQALAAQAAVLGVPLASDIPVVRQEIDGLTAENVARQLTQTIYGDQQ